MKTAKIIKISVLVLVVLLVAIIGAFYAFGEQAIKKAVEKAATEALGVEVTIGDIDLSIFNGTVEIRDLIVKNPEGYAHENFIKLVYGRVDVDIASLLEDTVRIKKIELDGMELVIEQKLLSNNMQDILNALPHEKKQRAEPSGKNLQISELEISNIKVKAKLLPVPGKIDTIQLTLSPIKMSNLGSDDKLSIGILTSKILVAIADGVVQQGTGVLPASVTGAMKTTLGKTIDIGKTTLEEGGKLLDKSVDIGTGIVEGFKGLLKPKKEKK